MIIGVGVDLVYIETIEKSRNIPGFLSKIFSKEELIENNILLD